ncbi:MAG: sigma-70 family RNA polymerase sigma factor [Solirubrobacterales bacterium]|nr:sigma-70 family RNA polymerase sigma factor [Solirubrobacterales bacterium]
MTVVSTTKSCRRQSTEEVARLVRAAAAGDQQSWNELVQEFGGMIRAIARAHRLCDADAADVAQATWLELFDHLDRLREPGRVGAWLATTARHECLAVLRHSQRNVPCAESAFEQECTESPDERLLTAERDTALWRGFSRLRTSDQRLLRMLMAEPSPAYEEVSAALDMPVGSIGPTRARALGRLRRQIDCDGALSLLAA